MLFLIIIKKNMKKSIKILFRYKILKNIEINKFFLYNTNKMEVKMLRKNSGITLVSLVVIIIVVLILAGTATYTGITSVQSARIATFEAELKTVRLQLNSSSEIEKYKKLDTDKLTDAQIKFLNEVQTELNNENLGITLNIDNFKYFSKQDIKNLSSIEITRDVYVDAINKIVVSGIAEQYDGKTYYVLEQLEDGGYNIEENIENSGDITFDTKVNNLTVEISNITYNAPYVNKGTIQYKLDMDKNWTTVTQDTTSKNVSFNVSEYGVYNIKVIDAKNNENETKLEVISNASDGSWNGVVNSPKLVSGMTGVYWDENGKEVKVTNENKDKWYDYENQKWANAVTKDGSYWVWIPRYEYSIETATKTINIKFIKTTQIYADDDYTYVHPAFRNGTDTHFMNGEWDSEIPGFWVAKYSAGFQQCSQTLNSNGTVTEPTTDVSKVVYSNSSYTSFNSSYATNALSQTLTADGKEKLSYPVFKPLTYAYNNISIGDAYTISQEIDSATAFYGLTGNTNASHLMKNSEWGAVAYLTQSSFGRNRTEVTINSKNLNNLNSKHIYAVTGYAENTALGVNASSTNNISGVFDLSGCVWERVAGYITNGNPNLRAYGSSFANTTSNPEGYKTLSTKYATVYPYNSTSDTNVNNWTEYNNLKTATYGYGDVILETSTAGIGSTSWNGDYSTFAFEGGPFFLRGGYYGDSSNAGAFAFDFTLGYPYYFNGFRACLTF